ncbi:hypothetical protein PC129_g7536 [Phytophthora cactorum]|uniref:Uncharacterized protein n=1 Tax=Phytophthora cactorum TaxID=29920 RepID=A0A8T1DPI7_9STRA|nr:hypothetical protein Pcac1_g15008 [Phytophthora cactorum]KAG2828114.1 hypothetical protein PC111_g8316 [Phytophthora cactorum]KAG2829134.1 hypothetical protein PC112_g8222 [Phytophthora cactorum]KAG2860268.1 hypothetical protein PC113_g8225 [Phytophthora cactorum]KAG2908758.1 hypothetical protein PC114_g10336 [Phytophthora cactorum]
MTCFIDEWETCEDEDDELLSEFNTFSTLSPCLATVLQVFSK